MGRIASDAPALVAGTRLAAARITRRDGGRVLVGGSPRRLLRLTDSGAALAAGLLAGEPATTPAARALGRRLVDAGLARPYPPAGPRPTVTVLIPVRDRPVEALLDALGDRDPVVVVDDGSIVPVRCDRRHVTVVRLERAVGPAAARMRGLQEIGSDVVACVDSDVLVPPGWLEPLLAHLADPRVAAVAPRVRPDVGDGLLGRYLAARSPLDLGPDDVAVGPGSRVPYVPTAALVVRRDLLSLDPSLRYGEDVDLVWRLVAAGREVRYEPRVEVRHSEPRGWIATLRRRHRYGTSAGALHRRHPDALAHLQGTPLQLAAAACLLAAPASTAAVAAGAAAAVTRRRLRRAGLGRRDATVRALTAEVFAADAVAQWLWVATGPGALLVRRRLLLAVPALRHWSRRRPAVDPARFALVWLLDDLAYATGVWRSVVGGRTLGPLLPRVRAARTTSSTAPSTSGTTPGTNGP